jgi:hypothetical protein
MLTISAVKIAKVIEHVKVYERANRIGITGVNVCSFHDMNGSRWCQIMSLRPIARFLPNTTSAISFQSKFLWNVSEPAHITGRYAT